MVVLVALLQSSKDGDGAELIGLVDHHRLESALKGLVLLEVFLILVEGGGTNGAQFTTCKCRFEDVSCIHGTLATAGTNKSVDLVDEQDDATVALGNLVDDTLKSLLELTFIFRTCDKCAHVERVELLVLKVLGHIATNDTTGQSLNDSRLTSTRLTYKNRVVLSAAGENLQYATDLVITTDDWVELALTSHLNKILGELLKTLVVVVGTLRLYLLTLTKLLDG